MSQDTPSKGRIERHLMRQRGAGVRAVTANFGFSFAPSFPSTAPTTPSREPPTKRRKTAVQSEIIVAQVAAEPEGTDLVPLVPSPSTRECAKPQERLGQDAQPQPVVASAPEGTIETTSLDRDSTIHNAPRLPSPAKRPTKATKPRGRRQKPRVDDKPGEDVEDSFVQTLKSRRKPVRKAKTTAVVKHVAQEPELSTPPPAIVKKAPRKRKLPVSPELVPAPSRGRPKRQAAVSATEKVSMGFEVEDASVDKMRQAALKMGRKKSITNRAPPSPPATEPPLSPPSTQGQDAVAALAVEPVTQKTGRVRKAPAAKRCRAANSIEIPSLEDPEHLAKETSQPEVPEAGRSALEKPAGGRKRKAAAVEVPLEETKAESERPPAKRGRKTATKKAAQEPVLDPLATNNEPRRLSTIKEDPSLAHMPNPEHNVIDREAHAASTPNPDPKTSKAPPSKARVAPKRKPLGEADANIIRPSLSPEKLATHPQPSSEPTKPPPQPKRRKRLDDISPEKSLVRKRKQTEPASTSPSEPANDPVRAATDAKDLDWLFTEPTKKKASSAALKSTARGTGKKAPFRFADRSCKDMDLDDLLESVAAFSSTRSGKGRTT